MERLCRSHSLSAQPWKHPAKAKQRGPTKKNLDICKWQETELDEIPSAQQLR
jgi:hypothetical protein